MKLDKRFAHGLQALVAYTYSTTHILSARATYERLGARTTLRSEGTRFSLRNLAMATLAAIMRFSMMSRARSWPGTSSDRPVHFGLGATKVGRA